MAIEYRVDNALGVVFMTARGTISDDEIVWEALAAREALLSFKRALLDVSAVERVDVTTAGVQELSTFSTDLEPLIREIKLAIYAPQDVMFGLARMFQSMRDEDSTLAVFRERNEALVWLGIPGESDTGCG